jgi:hypothetical protein
MANMEEETKEVTAADLRDLLEQNIQLSRELQEGIHYIKRYVVMSQALGILKLLLIVVPLVLGIIYLPPLLADIAGQYQEALGGSALPQSTGGLMDLVR